MKKISLIISVLLILTFVLAGCSNEKDNNINSEETNMNEGTEYIEIGAEDAKKVMDSEEVIVLDVRTQAEYDDGHIENAVLLPVDEISAKAEDVLKDKNAKILVYCRSGNRSATAARTLINMGYTNVYDFGGIIDWPYEIVK